MEAPKKRRSKTAKRFTDEQIKSLESIFNLETKIEPRKKLQLAKDLGLHPRQVSIWFQNRRARWKSKQIEQDYRVLKANYDSLHLQFDDLKREKQSLQMQLQELRDLLKNLHKVDLADGDTKLKDHAESPNEEMDFNDDKEQVINFFGKTEDKTLSWGKEEEEEEDDEEISRHLAAAAPQTETWCNLSSAGIFDQSSIPSEWWEN